jgi:phosphate:Na+ symporter
LNTILLIINIIFGLGIFLYGLKILSKNLERVSSDKLKILMDFLTKNKVMGLLFGAGVTSILQSSSATTVLVVGFANAGIIGLTQCISIIFGANIGTTITAQIMAFKTSNIAIPLIGFGSVLYLFTKEKKYKNIGEVLVGLGLLFFGLSLLGGYLKPFKDNPMFLEMMTNFGKYPMLGLLVGAIITAIVQSSSASTGMIITLAAVGALDFQAAFCLALGTNIGTTITAQIAAFRTNVVARRAAVAHTLFNVVGSLYMLALIYVPFNGVPIFLAFVDFITPGQAFMGQNVARHIANAHTIFNVLNAIVLFPFIGLLAKITERLIPDNEEPKIKIVKYLDERVLETPTIALSLVSKEVIHMIETASKMNMKLKERIVDGNKALSKKINENESTINILQEDIISFLVNLEQGLSSKEDLELTNVHFKLVERLERMGDHITTLLFHYEKLESYNEDLPKGCIEDYLSINKVLQAMFNSILGGLHEASEHSIKIAEQDVKYLFCDIETVVEQIRERQIDKVRKKEILPKVNAQYMEIINHMERAGEHLFKISPEIHKLV